MRGGPVFCSVVPNATNDNDSMPSSPTTALSDAQRRAVGELLRVSPVADDLAGRFQQAGFKLALVGGSVRDALLGRLGNDLDFTTDARPEQVRELLSGWAETIWDTGIQFGTLGAFRHGTAVEITTFRADSYDRVGRNPDVDFGDSLAGDLGRRDFTVNSMAVRVPDREFADPFGGIVDLAERVLRTPGAPEDSFSDDPLRMMRAARFAAQLGFTVAPEVLAAMTGMAERITIVSAERVRDELVKLLLAPDPVRGLRLLVQSGLADHVLPELPALAQRLDGRLTAQRPDRQHAADVWILG